MWMTIMRPIRSVKERFLRGMMDYNTGNKLQSVISKSGWGNGISFWC